MDKKKLEAIISESEEVRNAIVAGAPREEAVKIYLESNEKVEKGEWVELWHQEPRYGTSEHHPHATSIVRFWGPAQYLEGKKYLSRSKAEDLFEKGFIGKTHELVRGSSEYGEKLYEKTGGKWQRKRLEGRISERYEGGAYPPLGSHVLHRHWEIKKMYEYQKRREVAGDQKTISIILIFFIGFLFLLVWFQQKGGVGYAAAEIVSNSTILALLFLVLCLIFIYFYRKRIFHQK
ncbi:hypothetical protein HYS50_01365 [Candidatus Woesearchaeota archaeon]|nr:hypothetical protein [Candidatus Woesearchaeota archaeon]